MAKSGSVKQILSIVLKLAFGVKGNLKSRPVATSYTFGSVHKDLSPMKFLSLKEVSGKQKFLPGSPGETRKFYKYNMLGLTTIFINNR